ncbi:transglycosylase domain-containing protein [Paenibacillus sp.]|jgi:penicillin-binding protein|uniref:transglycosylase domain-containing protein n=1 Tax=Paenibacillus sp. TaxID=58172 RepID=UPI0028320A15|nr:transglycosylase domain-containing protein [Paenibacillus sp.]MDR0271038.1 transglycosylase domain-containing protein [Paenibacillus sp.]
MVENNNKKTDKPPATRRQRSIARTTGLVILWIFVVGLMGVLFVGGTAMGYVAYKVKDEPVRSRTLIDQKMSENAITSFAYFGDQTTPIGQIRTDEDRRPVEYKQIPITVINAVVSIEDNDFFTHKGVDLKGTLRAVKQKLLHESVQTGGSTLTQQLARRVFLSLDKTDDRKIKEILLSLRLERFMTKEEILTAYLNKVPFGKGASGYNLYGVKAAAKGLFNINDLSQLNIAESAYLAGLPQLPTKYSAYNSKGFNPDAFKRALDRQHLVLRRMLEENKITDAQYQEAMAFDIRKALAPPMDKAYTTYPYLMMEVERQASDILMQLNLKEAGKDPSSGEDNSELLEAANQQLKTGGYRVYTTIDKRVYSSMHKIGENKNNFGPDSKTKGPEQTAAMMIDNKTGAILGMLEGRDFNKEQMNYATQMIRQPGSAMKPIAAYLPALESGAIQPASILDDAPIILKDGQKGFHIPKNASKGYSGLMSARTALNKSVNTIALKLFNNVVGIDNAWAFSKKLGITTLTKEDYSHFTGVLGGLTYGVTVEELTNAYSAIGNQGSFNDAYMIGKIVDSNGKIIYQHEAKPVQAFSKQTAYLMTDMLRTVVTEGTGDIVRKNYKHLSKIPIVGKTGSTQNYADVWFMGYSPDVTLGVWVGYKEPKYTLDTKDARKRAQSLWTLMMNEITDKEPDLFTTPKFGKPDGIISKTVSAYSGKIPTSLTDKFVTDLFNVKYVPTSSDDGIAKVKYITYNGVNYIPKDETPTDMLLEKVVVNREKPIPDLIKELEAAFAKMRRGHEPLANYIPRDAGKDMPTQIDPRVDDGSAPSAPANVRMSLNGSKATITFNPSGQADVVGYRLYRSQNGGSFQNTGSVVLVGNATSFTNAADAGSSFYVTAVDVAGKESVPSATVNSLGGGSIQEPGDKTESTTPGGNGDSGTELPDIPDITDPEQGLTSTPAAPTGLQFAQLDNGIQFQWDPSASAEMVTEYHIYSSEKPEGPYNKIGSSREPGFQYEITAPIQGYFRVTAVNSVGESKPSAASFFEKK